MKLIILATLVTLAAWAFCPSSAYCPNHSGLTGYYTGQYCGPNCARYQCSQGHTFDVRCSGSECRP